MNLTLNESGKALTIHFEGITLPSDYDFATVRDFVYSHEVSIDELQVLCLGMSEYIGHLQQGECICTRCGVRQAGRQEGEMPDF